MSSWMRVGLIIIIFFFLALFPVHDAQTQASLTLTVTSGQSVSASVTKADVEAGRVEILNPTVIEITANVNWQVVASVVIDSFPAGTGNPTALALEVGNNDQPGQFNAGGGLVQTGVPGSFTFSVDFRINLLTLGNAPAGNYGFTITYTIQAQ